MMVKDSKYNKRKRQEKVKEKEAIEQIQVPIKLEENSDEVEGSKFATPSSAPPTHRRRKGQSSNVYGSGFSEKSSSKINKNLEKFLLLGKDRYYGSQKVLKGRTIDEAILDESGKGEMGSEHKLFIELENKCLLPRTERRRDASYRDLGLMEMTDTNQKVNLPLLTLKDITQMITPEKSAHG
ncbi:hypothetical protein HAX54_037724 [Datura stramonium]|uniref:Uncharacterized protein n=1 Tax=Datura stramonium TaxID=4076 RepID=A0ABS8VMR3_DATST|nr:hypothetical protein [Datura stramonium]